MKFFKKFTKVINMAINEFEDIWAFQPNIIYQAFLAVIFKSQEVSNKIFLRRWFEQLLVITAVTMTIFLYLVSGATQFIKGALELVFAEHICEGFAKLVAILFVPVTILTELYLIAIMYAVGKNLDQPFQPFLKALNEGAK